MKLKSWSNQNISLAPSVLAADFSNLQDEIKKAESAGAEILHLDVMDGHFVPNISFGPSVIAALRPHSNMLFDAHLMITHPIDYIEAFAKAGCDHVTIHVESDSDMKATINKIHALGMTAGLSLKPGTGPAILEQYIDSIDLVLIMTVEPGFGGQSFMNDMMPKISEVQSMIAKSQRNIHLQVDGGISNKTIKTAFDAGARCFVAGTAYFRHAEGMQAADKQLRDCLS